MRWWQSFYWRSAAALFGIAAALAAAGVYLSLRTTRAYQDELEQRLNLKLAANLVKDSVVLADGRVVRDGLEHVFHTLMVINPRIEVYLLDPDGRILEYSAGEGVVRLDAVSLAPIGELLSADPRLPIRGDDPRHPGRLKTFSVAPVPAAGPLEGYLYVVLAGQEYESAVGLLGQSHILKLGAGAMVAATLLALAGGLWLFGGLAGRLRRLDAKIERARPRQVGDPDHGGQDADRAGDEIDRLDASFDRMQRLIDRQVQELRELDGLRRELIANVSHDLRTPLASLQGYLETVLLKSDQLSEAERTTYLEAALRHSAALGRLVAELFDLARLDSGDIRPAVEPFSLAELCQDVGEKFRPAAAEAGVTLHTDLPQQLPFARGDLGLIERVISNLLDNAIRHTPRGGAVTLSLDGAGAALRVVVQDTGTGIAAHDLPHIFERFYRGRGTSGVSTGTGLGLAIAKRIVELHDGAISVDSLAGRGARFAFTLSTGS